MSLATNLVRLTIGRLSLGLDMGRVLGIERAERMKPLPDRPDLAGHLTNRAGDWPVLDLASRFGIDRKRDQRAAQIVLTAIAGERYGLLVDRTAPVPRSAATDVCPVPQSLARRGMFYDGVLVVDGAPLLLFNPDRLSETVDLFAPDDEPRSPISRKSITRTDRMIILGQFEYPLPGGRIVGFGLPIACIAELIEAPMGTPVPGTAEHVRELSEWRGRALPILDLSIWCGLPVPAAGNRRALVIRTPHAEAVGLLVGHGVRIVPLPMPSVPARRTITLHEDRVLGVFDTNEQTVVIPNLAMLTGGA